MFPQEKGEDPVGLPDFTLPVSVAAQEIETLAVDIKAQTVGPLAVNITGVASTLTFNVNISSISSGVAFDVRIVYVASDLLFNVNIGSISAGVTFNVNIQSVSSGVTFNVSVTNASLNVNISSISSGVVFNVAQSGSWTINIGGPLDALGNVKTSIQSSVTLNVNIASSQATINVNISSVSQGVTFNVNIVGSTTINVNISSISTGVTFNVNIQSVSSGVTFNVNIQSAPTLNVNIASQSATINVDVRPTNAGESLITVKDDSTGWSTSNTTETVLVNYWHDMWASNIKSLRVILYAHVSTGTGTLRVYYNGKLVYEFSVSSTTSTQYMTKIFDYASFSAVRAGYGGDQLKITAIAPSGGTIYLDRYVLQGALTDALRMSINACELNLPIDIKAQSVGNIGVDIKAQTVGNIRVEIAASSATLNVNIASVADTATFNVSVKNSVTINVDVQNKDAAGNVKINFMTQNSGVFLEPQWAAKTGTDKDFNAYKTFSGSSALLMVQYVVPTGYKLLIHSIEWTLQGASDGASNIEIDDYTAAIVKFFGGGKIGGAISLNKPLVIPAGHEMDVWMRVYVATYPVGGGVVINGELIPA